MSKFPILPSNHRVSCIKATVVN